MTKHSEFENKVREYAAIRFGHPFRPEHLAGIDFDCVASPQTDYKIIVEATQNHTLEKVRGDTARLQIVRQKLIGEGIYAKVYLVLGKEPTNYMQEGGKAANVEVLSFSTFYRQWYDSRAYNAARKEKPFGSAFRDGEIGPDKRPYIPVYFESHDGQRFTISEIARRIRNGERMVLTGEFGTGKSRAIQQLFDALTPKDPTEKSPVSIDLRTMWGTQNAEEVLLRHYSSLQLSALTPKALDALYHNEFLLLLDGFDELAIQSWGGEPEVISESRARTMLPIRDLLNRTQNGALITGRAHYFSSDSEMISALGLNHKATVISTPPEFSTEELTQFMGAIGFSGEIPLWLPRKPLVAEMFVDFVQDGLKAAGASRPAFWENFIEALCRRDSKIRESYEPESIKQILCKLSRSARKTTEGRGPISPTDVQNAFSEVVGQLPAQEAASMLQRLPGLGRVAAENDDRQFVDDFIVEGLRGLDVATLLSTFMTDLDCHEWKHGAGDLGLEVIANRLDSSFTYADAVRCIQNGRGSGRAPLVCDVIGALLSSDLTELDFTGSDVEGGYISTLDMSGKSVTGLRISGCEIGSMNIFNSVVRQTKIADSTVSFLDGASGEELPTWIVDCIIGERSSLDTVSRIRRTGLSSSQMILVTILRKTFFQPGSGRKEEALLRGLGEFGDAKVQARVLAVLQRYGFLRQGEGTSGRLFVPERSKTSRAARMMSQLQQSDDDIWREVTAL